VRDAPLPGYDALEGRFEEIAACDPVAAEEGAEIGRSREGRPLRAFRFGSGPLRLSLVAGCHADEPVGPRLLRRLAAHLADLPAEDPFLEAAEWWVLPHINPDGEARNAGWQGPAEPAAYDLASYLRNVVREAPGDDIEFGFPYRAADAGARPETRAVWSWWSRGGPFALHASLHGMSVGVGPWYLLEPGWRSYSGLERLMKRCRASASHAGYALNDVERAGEKGFHRLARGFATRPNHVAMREHFLAAGDPGTAALFRPSSMESVRALGGDALTLVSEMPLFLAPDGGEAREGTSPWRDRLREWGARLATGEWTEDEVRAAAAEAGLEPMPVLDQMRLQWALVCAGLEAVAARGEGTSAGE
jgi:hypothetical protein